MKGDVTMAYTQKIRAKNAPLLVQDRTYKLQKTVSNTASCTGVGVHSGSPVTITLKPAPADHGIQFVRTDASPKGVSIMAHWKNVVDTRLCSKIGNADGTVVSTVEHLMAALAGCEIDNAIVEINGPEVPIMDGSAAPFVFLVECAGVVEQSLPRRAIRVLKEISVSHNGTSATLSPAQGFSLSFDFATPGRATNITQNFTFQETHCFKKLLARARTFGFYEDVEYLRAAGLARGGSLANAVVIKDGQVLNVQGLRYEDELVRHKLLDAVGDLYLAGMPLQAHYHGVCAGHALNHKLLMALFADESAWEIVKVPGDRLLELAKVS